MKNKYLRISLISVAAFAAVLVLSGCTQSSQQESTSDQKAAVQQKAQEMKDSASDKMEQMNEEEMKDIVAVAMGSQDHTTLVAAVKAAGLVETLQGAGPFTVFAPTNDAFEALPAGTVETLLKPENKDDLVGVLTYHVVPVKAMSTDVVKAIADNGGKYEVKTVAGGTLVLTNDGGKVMVTDENGNTATVVVADLEASNGVIHVIDKVLLPHSG